MVSYHEKVTILYSIKFFTSIAAVPGLTSNRLTRFRVDLHDGQRKESTDVGLLRRLDVRLAESEQECSSRLICQPLFRAVFRDETENVPESVISLHCRHLFLFNYFVKSIQ